jgi:hypothetical protein
VNQIKMSLLFTCLFKKINEDLLCSHTYVG